MLRLWGSAVTMTEAAAATLVLALACYGATALLAAAWRWYARRTWERKAALPPWPRSPVTPPKPTPLEIEVQVSGAEEAAGKLRRLVDAMSPGYDVRRVPPERRVVVAGRRR